MSIFTATLATAFSAEHLDPGNIVGLTVKTYFVDKNFQISQFDKIIMTMSLNGCGATQAINIFSGRMNSYPVIMMMMMMRMMMMNANIDTRDRRSMAITLRIDFYIIVSTQTPLNCVHVLQTFR